VERWDIKLPFVENLKDHHEEVYLPQEREFVRKDMIHIKIGKEEIIN